MQDCVCNEDKMCKTLRFSSSDDEISQWEHYSPLKHQQLFIINTAQELNLRDKTSFLWGRKWVFIYQ